MRILLANSNTSPEVTATIAAEARRVASEGTEIVARNARFGARVIGTRAEAAVAAHALVDMLAEHGDGADAVVIGMSLDTGLWAAREMLDVPVVGMTEAACLVACTMAPRFGLIALGGRGGQPYREVVEGYGLGSRLAGLRTLGATPQDLLRDPEALYHPLVEAALRLVQDDGAEAVVLAGAVMAGLPRILAERVPVPLVEGVSSGILLAEALVRLGFTKPRSGSLQPVPKRETIGLGPALAAFFAAER